MKKKVIFETEKSSEFDSINEYLNILIEQFKYANNLKKVDFNSSEFKSELDDWMKKRKSIGNNYKEILDYMDLDYDYPTTVEIGKGFIDSVVLGNGKTTIITPYTNRMDKRKGNTIIKGTIKSVSKYNRNKSIAKEMPWFNNFMTQNPYINQDTEAFILMHESYLYDIILGVYGSTFDKDKKQKINQLKKIKENLERNYKEEYIRLNDSYFYVIASDNKIRIRNKRK